VLKAFHPLYWGHLKASTVAAGGVPTFRLINHKSRCLLDYSRSTIHRLRWFHFKPKFCIIYLVIFLFLSSWYRG